MIAYIRGTLAEKDMTRVVVEAAGVGYELLIPLSTFDRLPREGGEVKLLAWHCVREDDEVLFGFATAQEREMFAKDRAGDTVRILRRRTFDGHRLRRCQAHFRDQRRGPEDGGENLRGTP